VGKEEEKEKEKGEEEGERKGQSRVMVSSRGWMCVIVLWGEMACVHFAGTGAHTV
jgi:hypothetical protein